MAPNDFVGAVVLSQADGLRPSDSEQRDNPVNQWAYHLISNPVTLGILAIGVPPRTLLWRGLDLFLPCLNAYAED